MNDAWEQVVLAQGQAIEHLIELAVEHTEMIEELRLCCQQLERRAKPS